MKHNYFLTKLSFGKQTMFLLVFLLACIGMYGQAITFRDGVAQGVIKVEFEEAMTTTLSNMQIRTHADQLLTGIQAFDMALNTLQATKMERLFPEVSNAALEAKHRRHGLHLWYIIRFDEEYPLQNALSTLKSVEGVNYVGVEYQKTLAPIEVTSYTASPGQYATQIFNDPMLKDQWHYINTGQLGLEGPRADINLGEAWKITAGSKDIIISVHDEGIDVNHEDLKANMWVNPGEIAGNGEDDDGNGYIDDVHGFNFVTMTGKIDAQQHGTHVAGTLGAVNNNGIGVSGVAGGTGKGDGVKMMSLQILGDTQSMNIARSFIYAADMGAVISQNSWGYDIPDAYERDVLVGIDYFIDTAGDYTGSPMKGGLVIFASGNNNSDRTYYPGYYDRTFSVSAIGPEYKKAIYSNYGNWVEVAAPGGDQTTYEMAKAGVLSTLPNNQYGYIHGTSMAAPHVSGIAALVLANRTKQMTNTELWNILLTSTIDLDKYNPNYIGKLGTGTMDAALALKTNTGVAPDAITTLKVIGMSQEFASLEWLVPDDKQDGTPAQFIVYYSEDNLTSENLDKAQNISITNKAEIGDKVSLEVPNLKPTTTYYFGVVAVDRWGNRSSLSNIAIGTTNAGPSIAVDTGNAQNLLSINASMPTGVGSESFKLLNKAEGTLRWNTYIRNTGHTISPTAYSSSIPKVNLPPKGVGSVEAVDYEIVKSEEASGQGMDFTSKTWKYVPYTDIYIGDTDFRLPTSGALKFNVTEPEGFNLTQIGFSARYTLGTGPIIIEIYEGDLNKRNLRRTESLQPTSTWNTTYTVPLKEYVFFKQNTSFYIVVHIPGGNTYPLGIGDLDSTLNQGLSWYSSNLGEVWQTFSEVGVSTTYAWNMVAYSQFDNIGTLLTLSPSSGTLNGGSETSIEATTKVSKLINGTYKANIVFESNDSKSPEFRMPVEVKVSGQKPNIVHPQIVSFGNVFKYESKTIDILIENYGYGLLDNLKATVNNPQFEIVGSPTKIPARSTGVVRVKFSPISEGNTSGILKLTDGITTYTISLFGVGTEVSKIAINPEQRTFSDISIGDIITSEFTISNEGKYPLQYFIPGYDTHNNAASFGNYHKAGYIVRSNIAEVSKNELVYNFKDINSSGVDITKAFIDSDYASIDLPFDFPFYDRYEKKIYITKKGFTVFDNTSYPHNAPALRIGLGSYISPVGFGLVEESVKSKVYYRAESDHVIIQYTDLVDVLNAGPITAQIVLYINGDIRFYYKEVPKEGRNRDFMTVLIEDRNRSDGILVRNRYSNFYIENNTAIGFDYSGPDIIVDIENGSGIIAPNESQSVKASMQTSTLSEGATRKNIIVFSNDPLSPISSHTASLEITSGGFLEYEFSTEILDFDLLYTNHEYNKEFSIKNTGTKRLDIENIEFDVNALDVSMVSTIYPGVNQLFQVIPKTENIGKINQIIKFIFSNGEDKEITVLGQIKEPPNIAVDLALLSTDLEIGDPFKTAFEIENTGGSDLEVSIVGGQWYKFIENGKAPIKNVDYFIKKENNGEPSYNWINILETGQKLPSDHMLTGDKELYWSEVKLPFNFTFYEKTYSSVRVGDNGVLAFGGDPDAFRGELLQAMPIDNVGSAYIFAMFNLGFFDTYKYPDEAGVYAQVYDDKVVISWMYYVNLFGWGQSAQVILFKDGSIKIMYKMDPSTPNGTGNIIVGLQDIGGEDFKIISSRNVLIPGQGLAFVILPEYTYLADVGEKIQGDIVLDTKDIYGGNFEDNFLIKTNIPSKSELKKPVAVNVNGKAIVDVISEVDLGELEVFYDERTGLYNTIYKNIKLTNTGRAPLRVLYAKMQDGNQNLTMSIGVPGFWGTEYLPVSRFTPENFPQAIILPGSSYNLLLSFTPKDEGKYEDILILETSVGDINITMKGFGYYPAVFNVDMSPIISRLNKLTENSKHTIKFDNVEGGYKLDYNIYINYLRKGVEARPLETLGNTNYNNVDSRSIQSLIPPFNTIIKPMAEPNRILKYFDETKINNAIGNQGFTSTHVATRFVADATGFNLAEVVNLIQVDGKESGTYKVEVRVGGEDITTAKTMAIKEVNFNNSEILSEIMYSVITLDEPIQILPNEGFYILISYPYNLTYPEPLQIGGVEVVAGRYLWYDANSGWIDFQNYVSSVDRKSGYTMYVVENEFKESGWIKILSPSSGTLNVGDASELDIDIVASFGERGEQKAEVVFASTDVNASVVKVPVSLYINQGPQFIKTPSSVILSENETITLDIEIEDLEEHKFSVGLTDLPKFASFSITETNSVKLNLSPDYGDQGNYTIKITAVDEYDAASEHLLNIHVAKTNRAPELIGTLLEFRLGMEEGLEKFDIKDYFIDPDGDAFTFVVESKNSDIIDAYQSGFDAFVLEPSSEGETELVFHLKDIHGASSTLTIKGKVTLNKEKEDVCVSAQNILVQMWNSTFVVNNPNNIYVAYQWYKNGIKVEGATKQYFSERSTQELDVHVQYSVELTRADGRVETTCPIQPVRYEASVKAFPNPIKSGASVTVVTQLPNLEANAATIQVVNMNGQVLQTLTTNQAENTINMPYGSGVYIIKVSNQAISKSFKILVN